MAHRLRAINIRPIDKVEWWLCTENVSHPDFAEILSSDTCTTRGKQHKRFHIRILHDRILGIMSKVLLDTKLEENLQCDEAPRQHRLLALGKRILLFAIILNLFNCVVYLTTLMWVYFSRGHI